MLSLVGLIVARRVRPSHSDLVTGATRSIVMTDRTATDNPICYVNPAFTALTGYTAQDVIGLNCRFLQGPQTDRAVVAEVRHALDNGLSIRRQILNYRKDGTSFWNDLTLDPMRDQSGQVTGYVASQHDASALYSTTQQRRTVERQLASILDDFPGYVFQRVMDRAGGIRYPYFSAAVFRMLGLPPNTDWSNGGFAPYIHPDDRDRVYRELLRSKVNLEPFVAEYRMTALTGRQYWFRTRSTPRTMPNGNTVWNGVAVDITAEKAAYTRLADVTDHDSLTGLPNRVLFNTLLAEAVASARSSVGQLALFYIDLDDFQAINNTFGLTFGDKCLRRVCLGLSELPELKDATIARLGGDEFVVLLPSVTASISLLSLADLIRSCIIMPLVIDGQTATLEACVGVAALPVAEPGIGAESGIAAGTEVWAEMLKRAHLALQSAKQTGPGICRLYSAEFDDRVRNQAILRQSLQRAVVEEQFEVHYQPVIDLRSGKIVGAEALVRWNHPELGFQRPDMFIPLAETTGLIGPLGHWILQSALKQGHAWQQRSATPLFIAVNLSSVQLQRPGFVAAVEQALAETGANATGFEFELTEGTLIEATESMQEQLQALKRLGFALTIDDFGTGHSTFQYLRNFPFDKLKIDQSFVRQIGIDTEDTTIVRAMITLSHDLKLKVVAEGVETVQQRDVLRDENCDLGQGYLFSPPLRAEDLGWLLESGLALPRTDPALDRPQ